MKLFPFHKRSILTIIVATGIILNSAIAHATDNGPIPAAKALADDGQMILSESDRCPVCAMFPGRYPQTAAALTLKSGRTFYFCSNDCLLRTWLRPTVYLGKKQEDIDRLVVRDYFSGKNINGRTATWIAGSDVIGPMGPAVIALGDADHLATFKKRHGGSPVFNLNQLDDDLWKQLSTRKLPPSKSD